MIVDREREIESFIPEPYWEISLTTEKDGQSIVARHAEGRFTDKKAADAAYAGTKDPLVVTEVKEGKRVDRAPTPFDTTQFIVAAARIGYSAANAMRVAEELYMNGFISYPRTDNTIYPPSLNLDSILTTLEKTKFGDVAWVRKNRRPNKPKGKSSKSPQSIDRYCDRRATGGTEIVNWYAQGSLQPVTRYVGTMRIGWCNRTSTLQPAHVSPTRMEDVYPLQRRRFILP